jgi:nitrate/TMAO reductase-like tetraheme cytochrome c subunit
MSLPSSRLISEAEYICVTFNHIYVSFVVITIPSFMTYEMMLNKRNTTRSCISKKNRQSNDHEINYTMIYKTLQRKQNIYPAIIWGGYEHR